MGDRSVRRGLAIIAIALVAMGAMLLVPKHGKKAVHPPNDDPWVLVSYDPDNKFGTYLGNGFISTRIMGDGVGSQDGKPLPCYMAGLYDDEKLIPTPTWSDLRFYDGKTQFKIDKDADYKQTLNMKTGILTTYATWRAGRKTLKGKIEVIVLRAIPGSAIMHAELTPNFNGSFVADTPVGMNTDRLEKFPVPQCATCLPKCLCIYRCRQSGICIAMSKFISSSASKLRVRDADENHFSTPVKAESGKQCFISSHTSIGKGNSIEQARQALSIPDEVFFKIILDPVKAQQTAWAKLWQRDIVIDGPKKDQQALHSCMFYLLQSVREGSQWSIPPMGLSGNDFSGHVFWDADTWMFPALILQHPQLARSIVDYRFNTLPGAMANAKANGFAGAEYAWESGMTGKEDTPPGLVYRYERHINGDVALAQWQYYLATGDLKWLRTRGYPVIKATADYWLSRVIYNSAMDRYEIKQVVPPDENADRVNNSAYTNAIARLNLAIAFRAAELLGVPGNPKWGRFAYSIYLPFDEKAQRFVAYDAYKGEKAKQADTELLIYPLQTLFPGHDLQAVYKNTFDYYASKVMPKGPAMSSSAHSVIAARLGERDQAYRAFTRSYKPYLRGPFNYFNETPSEFRESYCFLTGAAGPIQATIFGMAGAQMDYFPQNPASADLTFAPCLPKQWKSMKITGVQWHGKTFDMRVTQGNKAELVQKQKGDK